MECSNCKFVRENVEDFYHLSLEVKHLSNLYQGLEKFMAGDVIFDYYCDKCEETVNLTRKTHIERLPSYLIVHLQRIVFDFDSYANKKINSQLDFPTQLNVYPYTSGTYQEGDCEYQLIGVVAHSGTAEIGHYYSFIRLDGDQWAEFNDSVVKPFQ